MSDNEIEDVQFIPGERAGKRSVYEPRSLEKCKQMICSPGRSALIVTSVLAVIFFTALVASLARPAAVCNKDETNQAQVSVPPTGAIATNNETFPWNDLRLPLTILPLTYDLFLHPNLSTFQFQGRVSIVIEVQEVTEAIVLHTKNLTISAYSLTALQTTGTGSVSIKKMLENKHHEQLYLEVSSPLSKDHKYNLTFHFSGYLNDLLIGFYRSSYKTKSGETRWLATTQFEATDARGAFPCFDEPSMKAQFRLSMVRDKDHMSLFNTEKLGTDSLAEDPQLFVDHFNLSLKMSTYLVAFVVSDFASMSAAMSNGKKVTIYAPQDYIDQAALAADVAPKILDYYQDYYGIEYPLSKSDQVAVPDFGAGAMENWGLVTYRMMSLLVDTKTAPPGNLQWVVTVIAHELAHQWFGDIVTMAWWNDLWLNEGFASFVEYIGVDHVRPEWKMLDQFLVSALWTAMKNDALKSSHPISVPVNDPAQIEEIFDSISYQKGASIIRMCNFFLGDENWMAGLRHYLEKHKYGNAKTQDLWDALSEKSGSDLDVAAIMDTWTLQMNYPVVIIHRNGNTLHASQERFLLNPKSTIKEEFTSKFGYKWQIPLSYTTDKSGYSKHELVWLKSDSVDVTLPSDVKWIKFNVNATGVYRVHYDPDMWDTLIKQLKEDIEVFSPADRASLIEDAFSLAQSGYLNLSKALDLSEYLVKEEEYVPWETAHKSLVFIGKMIKDKSFSTKFEKYELSLMEPLLRKDQWNSTHDLLTDHLQQLILYEALHLEHQPTVDKALSMFRKWMQGTPVEANFQPVVYASGAMYGGKQEWDFLLNKTWTASELNKKQFLTAIATTKNIDRLQLLLQWAIDPTKVRSQDATLLLGAVSKNSAGKTLAWNFIKRNWDFIYKTFSGMAFQLTHILHIPGNLNTQYDYDDVKQFLTAKLGSADRRSVSQSLERIEIHIDWLKNNDKTLEKWLQKY